VDALVEPGMTSFCVALDMHDIAPVGQITSRNSTQAVRLVQSSGKKYFSFVFTEIVI
jgi:hypothetical protein